MTSSDFIERELLKTIECHSEINDGVPVSDENGNVLGKSSIAAKWGITQVVFSRVGMASPGMGKF